MYQTIVSLFLLVFSSVAVHAQSESLQRLSQAIQGVVDATPGKLGVAVHHVESGQEIEINGNERFPMASTFKIAVLVELFHQIEQGKISLEDMVDIKLEDLHLGSGQLRQYGLPGVSLSVENLALLMMRISDNSATDKLMEMVGLDNIQSRMESLGITGLSLDRTCQRLILDWLGMKPEQTAGMGYQAIQDFLNAYKPEVGELEAAEAKFVQDLRDTATPIAMNQLLRLIFSRKAASPESCERMIDIMLKCETGKRRIQGLLPKNVRIAHKTGTLGGTVNNVGILYLPEGRGHVILSVLSKEMKEREEAERAIAEIARYVYDYFLFNGEF